MRPETRTRRLRPARPDGSRSDRQRQIALARREMRRLQRAARSVVASR